VTTQHVHIYMYARFMFHVIALRVRVGVCSKTAQMSKIDFEGAYFASDPAQIYKNAFSMCYYTMIGYLGRG